MPLEMPELDKIFCLMATKYKLEKLLLKAVAVVESSLNQTAYRFEPAFWENYLKNDPRWKDREPKEVSASYGLLQILYTTAVALGFDGTGEELYNPVINIELGAKLLGRLRDELTPSTTFRSWPMEIVLARYNGGSYQNPDETGRLRNYQYVLRVRDAYWSLRTNEKNCDES